MASDSIHHSDKECTKCGVAKPATGEFFGRGRGAPSGPLADICLLCRKEVNAAKARAYSAEYRAKNPGKVKAARRAYYVKNADLEKAKSRTNYRENHDYHIEVMRLWRERNRQKHRELAKANYHAKAEERRAAQRAYRASNVEWHRARTSEWCKANPDKVRIIANRRRARIAKVAYHPIIPRDVFDRDGWRCYICGIEVFDLKSKTALNKAELEHVIPLSRGGEHTMENLKCSCRRCNALKGVRRTPEEVRKLVCGSMGHQLPELG